MFARIHDVDESTSPAGYCWKYTRGRHAWGAQVYPDSPGLKLERRANIVWDSGGPKTVLLVKKPNSVAAAQKLAEMGHWCACAPSCHVPPGHKPSL